MLDPQHFVDEQCFHNTSTSRQLSEPGKCVYLHFHQQAAPRLRLMQMLSLVFLFSNCCGSHGTTLPLARGAQYRQAGQPLAMAILPADGSVIEVF